MDIFGPALTKHWDSNDLTPSIPSRSLSAASVECDTVTTHYSGEEIDGEHNIVAFLEMPGMEEKKNGIIPSFSRKTDCGAAQPDIRQLFPLSE
ncbi:hypothetical protein AVEN_132436-1 [Araneus ventricosus]|uniref:Uncharacterized protein n=1 Tax=Araneus ventricosus TaxID=182803 RepID=A0A4Y2IGX0_ARAVE|nr:hypothetical protein AVEN_132436-1 [Araneus ventricosus]